MRKKFSWSVFAIKITSRKLWVSLAGLATSIMAFANCNSNTIVQVTAIIGALGSVAGYLIANGLTNDTAVMTATEMGNTGPMDTTATPAPAVVSTTADTDVNTPEVQAAQAADVTENSSVPTVG